MTHYVNNPDYKHGTPAVTGVLLTNLGTPDAPTPAALRRYLAEFLADPRIVELPRLLWKVALHGVILNIRPKRSAESYKKVWMAEGSPLLVYSSQQAAALQAALGNIYGDTIKVALGMRYGSPSIPAALEELRQANATRLLVLPLYPQYSASTTASTFDAVSDVLKKWRWLPQFRMVMDYHQNPAWVAAVAQSIRDHWDKHGRGQKLMLSFHGLPKRFLLNGDPYHCQCHASARLIAERLQLADDEWQLTFQSRFGREEWLKPYCDHTLVEWAQAGVERVDMVCPGFSADCLETLEEIAMQNRDVFLQAGGKAYRYIPALNDRPDHIEALAAIVENNLQGWPNQASLNTEDARHRALEMGAPR